MVYLKAPVIIVNNTMKWSTNWSLELRYVLVCSESQSKTVMDWGSYIRTFIDNRSFPPTSTPFFHTIQLCVWILECC